MKKCKIGILLLALTVALLTLAGCVRNRNNEDTSTTTDNGSPLVPSPDATLPGENGESETNTTNETLFPDMSESESMTDNTETTTEQDATTTTTQETTTTRQETTTTKQETTTTKQETTTKKPETTTSKQETTTTRPETTTSRNETTTSRNETTTSRNETTTTRNETDEPPAPIVTPGTSASETDPIAPDESITLPIPAPNESTPNGSGTNNGTPSESMSETTTARDENGSQTTVPESSAGEWLHFEAFEEDHAGAAAYLGKSAQELPVTDIIEYFDLSLTAQDITVIDNGDSEDADGDEWYLILPRYRDTVVRLHDAEEENGTTVAGELLAEGMHPILVRCDLEDGNPSVFVELIRGEEKITFSLGLDKESGEATFHDSILNITPEQTTRRAHR